MPIGATIGATLGAGVLGAGASIYASNQQSKAASNALALQKTQNDTAQGYLAPYRESGAGALDAINKIYGFGTGGQTSPNALSAMLTSSPEYKFAAEQGGLALDRSAAARGGLLSGGQLKDVTSFGQGLASQQFGNYFNRLMGVAQMGQSAAAGGANTASQFGQTAGNTMQQIGAANASGAVGAANAFSTMPQNLMFAQALGNMNSGGSTANSSSYGASAFNNNALAGTIPPGGFSTAGFG